MRALSSLTNRIFLAMSVVAVVSIAAAVWVVNVMVTAQAERELQRGLAEAGLLVQEYRQLSVGQLTQQARLIADLPKFKATVELHHPPTLEPLAADYRTQVDSDVFVVVSRDGMVLASEGVSELVPGRAAPPAWPWDASAHTEQAAFIFEPDRLLQVVTVPIWLDPEVLGTLSVGIALDEAFAARVKRLTDSEIIFMSHGHVHASTFAVGAHPALERLLAGAPPRLTLNGQDYVWVARPLRAAGEDVAGSDPQGRDAAETPQVVVLRSRSERLRFLSSLHTALAMTALVAVLASVMLSYAVARTVTRPLAAITHVMREMASTGDLTRRLTLPTRAAWDDEDARLLANTFNAMTASIARFQHEAAQRERLAGLGRLSTVLAHEVRNPLMIIKGSLHALKKPRLSTERVLAAAGDIDEEVARLNRLVNEVLDYAKPIRFELGTTDLRRLCEEAVAATETDGRSLWCTVDVPEDARTLVSDPERLRSALVNLVANARQAIPIDDVKGTEGPVDKGLPHVEVSARTIDASSLELVVRDRGVGIAADALPRIFEPYFTTRRTGTGIGLAIARNIIEGLGGTIRVSAEPGHGAIFRIQLPRKPSLSEA